MAATGQRPAGAATRTYVENWLLLAVLATIVAGTLSALTALLSGVFDDKIYDRLDAELVAQEGALLATVPISRKRTRGLVDRVAPFGKMDGQTDEPAVLEGFPLGPSEADPFMEGPWTTK